MLIADLPVVEGFSSDVCVIHAAKRFGVPADLMFAVRAVERGKPSESLANRDGTHDVNEPGLNTKTVRELVMKGWDRYRLVHDGCYSMYAAAYWMNYKWSTASGGTLLSKAARYHSATTSHNEGYQRKLIPFLANWGCYLHVYWRFLPDDLFVVQSGVLKKEDLQLCIK